MTDPHSSDGESAPTAESDAERPPGWTRVLAYNVRYELGDVEPRSWERRRDAVAETILQQDPDLVALQEVWRGQLGDLQERLPGYEWVVPKDGEEHAAIAYRSGRYSLVESGSRWLSEPETAPGVPGWDSDYQKRFVYSTLHDEHTDTAVVLFSVHLPFTGERAPREAMLLVREAVTDVGTDLPVVVAGDFNTSPGEVVYELANQHREPFRDLQYASDLADSVEGPELTFTGFPGDGEDACNIDHVLVTPDVSVVRTATVVPESETAEFKPSDHRPIVADVLLTE